MQFVSLFTLLLSLAAAALAITIPDGSPNGIYITTLNETGHEVTSYYSTPDDLPDAQERSPVSARDFFSARAAAPTLDKRQDGTACAVYTGINYQPAVDILSFTCGLSKAFRYSIAVQYEGAIAYGCDYGNGNWCDITTVQNLNDQVTEFCGPNANGWYNIYENKLSFGRTQAGTCYCWC